MSVDDGQHQSRLAVVVDCIHVGSGADQLTSYLGVTAHRR